MLKKTGEKKRKVAESWEKKKTAGKKITKAYDINNKTDRPAEHKGCWEGWEESRMRGLERAKTWHKNT